MTGKRYYIGLGVSGHDPAFSIVNESGEVLFAEATERFLQDKRALGILPDHMAHLAGPLADCCADATHFTVATSWLNPKPGDDAAAPSDHPPLEPFDPVTTRWLRHQQRNALLSVGVNLSMLTGIDAIESHGFDHHLCHAAFASASAPFSDGHCLVLDGEGEVGSMSAFVLENNRLRRHKRSWGPGSLGSYYAWLTLQCGFHWLKGEEWKVMGLAAFGTPQEDVVNELQRLLSIEGGKIHTAAPNVWRQVSSFLKPFRPAPGQPIESAADLAASGQEAFARWTCQLIAHLGYGPGSNLILTGGCALNSSLNGCLKQEFDFDRLHIPCAPADDGNAVGAALLAWRADHPAAPDPKPISSPYLGSRCDPLHIDKLNQWSGLSRSDLRAAGHGPVVDLLAQGKVIGVMRGRAEFGPRSLGNRSILASPQSPGMKDRINQRIKGREAYRPFAPVLRQEDVANWFENPQESPYMSFALRWRADRVDQVPAVVHENQTGRLQTVTPESNAWLHGLISAFGEATGVAVLLNTSFNIMGKPIVHSVEDALGVLFTTGLDAIVLEDHLIMKS
ncbi:hypothetical protein MLD52_19705 [Puniceicoccaceae bacterium K14]|nr:hypothetical protein [Puniceicoccaceae bacterium K14]